MIIYTQAGPTDTGKDISTVIELISYLDSLKEQPFYLNFVSYNIGNLGEDHPELIENDDFKFERLAFMLQDHLHMDAWGTIFGPSAHFKNLDGTTFDSPNLGEITPEAINYWESRHSQVSNPVLKIQYMGLVYCFKQRVTNVCCDQQFLEDYVRALINASASGMEETYMSTQYHLTLAMDIAKDLPNILPDVKAEFIRQTISAPDSATGVWLSYFNYMIKNLSSNIFSSSEKISVVSMMESRLASLMSKSPDSSYPDKLNPFSVEEVAMLLAQYYKQNNNKNEKERVVRCIESAFRSFLSQGNAMQQLLWLQKVQHCYNKYGMAEAAQALYPDIQQKGIEAKQSLQTYSYQISIPKELIEALLSEIVYGTVDDVYCHFRDKFTLKHSAAQDFVNKQSLNPLSGLMGTQILSESGMPLSRIGTPESDKEGNEYAFGAELIESEAYVLREVINVLISKQIFTKDLLVDHIMASGLIDSSRRFIIEKGVELYLANDYITTCHILMPQIEHGICNLAIKLGAPALRMQRDKDGYMVQLMDKLFDVSEIHDVLGDDKAFYLRTLLTEQRGLNLRNLLCHGLINPMAFDQSKADRLIHVLLIIGGIQIPSQS